MSTSASASLTPLGDQFVGLAGLGDARRMIVGDDHGGGIALQRELHDLARMHARAIDRAAEQLLELNEPMALVEQ